MTRLTRDAILSVDDLQREEVDVPEWGGSVLVRGLSGRERDAYEATIISQRGSDVKLNLANARAKLIVRAVIDDEGRPLFSEDDVQALAAKSAIAIERVYAVAQRLSGMSKDDLDELTKNSVSGRSAASGSS